MRDAEGAPVLFNEFLIHLSDEFDLDGSELSAESRLDVDLYFDSIRMLELILFIEDAAGVLLPESVMADLEDVGDVYHWYKVSCSAEQGQL